MVDSNSPELGSTQALTHMLDSMRKGNLDIDCDGNAVEVRRKLGEGGTKVVYEAVLDGELFALGVPNAIDSVEQMKQKWRVALDEPTNTSKIRDLGLLANPTFEAIAVNINGVPFPALKMARYQDLPFQVMDGKNVSSSTVVGNILPEGLDDAGFEEYFSHIVPDVHNLVQHGVRVGKDSINVGLVNGMPRLYLTDLGSAEFETFSSEAQPNVVERYVSHSLSAFKNGLTVTEYQNYNSFFNGESFKFDNPNNITKRISAKVLQHKPWKN